MNEEESLSGVVDHIVYSDDESGFTVAILASKDIKTDKTYIVGNIPSLRPGENISCEGKWGHHPTHGRQFQVSAYQLTLPKDLLGIKRFLASGAIKGIGPVNAERIVNSFGIDTLDILDKTPMRLKEIEGIGEKKATKIAQQWGLQKNVRDVMIFLRGHDVGLGVAKKIYRKYGDETIKILKENPYIISRQVFGIGFKTADKIAKELGIPNDSKTRVEAGLEFVLRELSDEGHTCAPEEKLILAAEKMLEVDREHFHSALITLESEGRIIRDFLPIGDEPVLHVWIKSLYVCEKSIAKELLRIHNSICHIRTIQTDKAINWVQEENHIRLAKEQEVAVIKSLEEKIHIITGGPGTGKSTVTKTILSIHRKLSDQIILCAPTGRAAKRLSEITKWRASTIHSLLEVDFVTGGFKRGIDNPLKCELLIVDESSMIDTYLMCSLLRAIPDHTRVIFIGDIDQLPSVGPGNILKDIIESQTIPLTRLFQIFRQGKDSDITNNAHHINRGMLPKFSNSKDGDCFYIEAQEQEEIAKTIVDLCKDRLPKAYPDFDPVKDIQVLSPMKRGIVGIENLNVLLQNELNPSGIETSSFGRTYRVGDKVMQIRNNYQKIVFNGDVGVITEIDREDAIVTVDFDAKLVEYEFTELDELVLAYAVSIHKYQGSECSCIILPLHTSHFKLLQRNLLYTGITRGKKLVIMVGSKRAIALAVHNNEVKERHTGLSYFLSESF